MCAYSKVLTGKKWHPSKVLPDAMRDPKFLPTSASLKKKTSETYWSAAGAGWPVTHLISQPVRSLDTHPVLVESWSK